MSVSLCVSPVLPFSRPPAFQPTSAGGRALPASRLFLKRKPTGEESVGEGWNDGGPFRRLSAFSGGISGRAQRQCAAANTAEQNRCGVQRDRREKGAGEEKIKIENSQGEHGILERKERRRERERKRAADGFKTATGEREERGRRGKGEREKEKEKEKEKRRREEGKKRKKEAEGESALTFSGAVKENDVVGRQHEAAGGRRGGLVEAAALHGEVRLRDRGKA